MFDEPVNGLDPEGILWIRNLMKALAAEGRTVFVSSHLMSEMENTADHLHRDRPGPADRGLHGGGVHRSQLAAVGPGAHARRPDALAGCVAAAGAPVREDGDGRSTVTRPDPGQVGDLAFEQRDPAARAGAGPGVAGGGVHGADRRQRGVPRGGAGRRTAAVEPVTAGEVA